MRSVLIGLGCLFLAFVAFGVVIAWADCSVSHCDPTGQLTPFALLVVAVVGFFVVDAVYWRMTQRAARRRARDSTVSDAPRDTIADK